MRNDHHWPERDTDANAATGEVSPVMVPGTRQPSSLDSTERVYLFSDDPLYPSLGGATEFIEPPAEDAASPADDALVGELLDGDHVVPPVTRASRFRRTVGKALMITGASIGVLVLLYGADLIISAGDVPRGVTVAGVDVGGMTHRDAETKLRQEIEPRLVRLVAVVAGDVQAELEPAKSGLAVDWPGTLEQAGHQPLSPITRLLSFFTTREVGVTTKTDQATLTESVTNLGRTQLSHDPVEGGIRFQPLPATEGGVQALPIEPRQGQEFTDVNGAVTALTAGWLNPDGVRLPVSVTPVKASSAGVHAALDQVVNPAVAGPVAVRGEGKDVIVRPDAIAGAFQFAAQDGGALEVRLDQQKLRNGLQPQLGSTEKQGKNAQILFQDDKPTVRPSVDGKQINWPDTFKPLLDVLKRTVSRELTVVYSTRTPELSTDDAKALGIKEVIGEFSTSGASGEAAGNVQRMARQITGAVVRPGRGFSLNAAAGPLTAAQGYVPAPVNEDGTGAEVIGGGVSQLTSTLYNAAYLAGLRDEEHSTHSSYVDLYPAARDAISVREDGSTADLRFTNDANTGIAIQATASGGSVSVKIWGTKRFQVQSQTGSQSNLTLPQSKPGPEQGCVADPGAAGFSTSDTRVLYDLESGNEVRRETRSVTYQPRNSVTC